MIRASRFFSKKRGDRSSASRNVGVASLGLFAFFFIVMGVLLLALFVPSVVVPEWVVNRDFVETTCRVLDKRLGSMRDDDDGLNFRPEIEIAYRVADHDYQAWTYDITGMYTSSRARAEDKLTRFTVGEEYPCWFDPHDPTRVVLARGYTPFAWLMLFLPVSFLALGAAGVAYSALTWGKSAERRAALAHSTRLELLDDHGSGTLDYPYVPCDSTLSDSPGLKLKYRLPAESLGWSLVGLLMTCVVWNGLVGLLAWVSLPGLEGSRTDWIVIALLAGFAAVGVSLVVWVTRQLMLVKGIGRTIVEISDHPLRIGGRYELFFSQSGRLTVTALEVRLICDEEAIYRQGTNTHVDRQRVWSRQVLEREHFVIPANEPLEVQCTLEIPEDGMHSFRSAHNRVMWRLVVTGDIPAWPDFERSFPVVVLPSPKRRGG